MKRVCAVLLALFFTISCVLLVSCDSKTAPEDPESKPMTPTKEETSRSVLLAPNNLNACWKAEALDSQLLTYYSRMCRAFEKSEKEFFSTSKNGQVVMSKSALCQSLDRLTAVCTRLCDAYHNILRGHLQREATESRPDHTSTLTVQDLDDLLAQYDKTAAQETQLEGALRTQFFSGSVGAPIRECDTKFSMMFQKVRLMQSLCAYITPTAEELKSYQSVVNPILESDYYENALLCTSAS